MDTNINLQTMPLRFRVWDKEDNRFITIYDLYPGTMDDSPAILFMDSAELFCDMIGESIASERFIISQDTDLKDKNGKSIYIGDICYYTPYERHVLVLYSDGMIVIKIQENEEYYVSQHLEHLIVVGNIWQNPELLEKKNEEASKPGVLK